MARVTIDDIQFAVEWLTEYEGNESDVHRPSCDRMIAWLKAEIRTREIDAALRTQETMMRTTAKQTGKPYAQVKARLRELIIAEMDARNGTK